MISYAFPHSKPLLERATLKGKNLLLRELFLLRVDFFSKADRKKFGRVPSSESVSIPLNSVSKTTF